MRSQAENIEPIHRATKAHTEKKFDLEKQIQQDIKDGKPISIIHFDKDKNVSSREDYNLENIALDPIALKGLCRHLAKECEKFYSDPENVKKFEEWKANKETNKTQNV